jgi:hypothetical protein
MENATGLVVPAGQIDIIRALRILANGNEIQESKPTSFFTNLTPWRALDGGLIIQKSIRVKKERQRLL